MKGLIGSTLVTIGLTAVAHPYDPAQDDPFMAIHMDNQKIGSEVSDFWQPHT